MSWKNWLAVSLLVTSAAAFAQRPPPAPPAPPGPHPVAPVPPVPPMPPHPPDPGGFHRVVGIPPHVAARLGIAPEQVKKVQDASFDANDALIGLEADLKRAQLGLEKALAQPNVDEGQVMSKLDAVGKAELAVRKNRMGLLLKIRKLLGNETWDKLQGEMPAMGMGSPGGEMRREVRIIRRGDGTETMEVTE